MESRKFSIPLEKNPLIVMHATPGHFTTSNSHVNHFLDLDDMKSNAPIARDVAQELATPYIASTLIETIVCMEGTEVVGAYLAEELIKEGMSLFTNDGNIHVLTPIRTLSGNLMFQKSTQEWIFDKSILLVVASVCGGSTMKRALECMSFYGGKVVGISALFCNITGKRGKEINALFTCDDIPSYQVWKPNECELCKAGKKIDAIVSSEGYTEMS